MKELTKKQKNILEYIERYVLSQGYPPTIRDMGENFSITPKGAYDHLKAIEKKGYIKCIKNRRRAIELLKPSSNQPPPVRSDMISIPLVGRIAAGMPVVAEENIESYLSFPRSIISQSAQDVFALTVAGDSMKDAGIFDGDIAIIQKQDTAQNGDIVVALLDDEATLKYFYREETRKRVCLKPANDSYRNIYPKQVLILGKLVGVYRSIH